MTEESSLDKELEPDTDNDRTDAGSDLVKVVAIRFRHAKTLWFDPQDHDPQPGDKVIVSTERGTEMGECVQSTWELAESELPAPLKPVLRIADEEDLCVDKELQDEERAAVPIFREYIERNSLDMKPADVEILFGKEKMIFYFSAEERIDFRQLVRDLAAHFHKRIEMRQVGVRDEARMTGGLGHCGEILCCARLGGEFAPVSIKMAKDQGLPLNPSKISGVCGRLMCCLRYEAEAYKDFNKRAPKKGALIDTPRGSGKVVERDALRETVKLQFRSEDAEKQGDSLTVPLARMSCKDDKRGKKGCKGCPCKVAPDVFEELVEESKQARSVALSTDGLDFRGLSSTQGTGTIDNGEVSLRKTRRSKSGAATKEGERKESSGQKRSRRRKKGRGKDQGQQQEQNQQGDQSQERSGRSRRRGGPSNDRDNDKNAKAKPKSRRNRRGSKPRDNRGGGNADKPLSSQGRGQRGTSSQKDSSRNVDSQVETRVPRRRRR